MRLVASCKLLLADDDESNGLTLSALLEDAGFEVESVGTFALARARLAAEGARYDLVLLDQHLGDGLGADLVPIVRDRLPRASVVMISGSLSGDDRLDHAADGYFGKGDDFAALLTMLERLLGAPLRPE